MRYGYYMRFSKKMLQSVSMVENIISGAIRSEYNRQLKKSFLWKPKEVAVFDQDADDFVRNLFTVRVIGTRHKMPRIAKRVHRPLPNIELNLKRSVANTPNQGTEP
jgi:hypothetical protein